MEGGEPGDDFPLQTAVLRISGSGLGLPEVTAEGLQPQVSLPGDIQDPPGQGPVQPAVGDPARGVGLYEPQRSLPTLNIL